MCIQSCSRPQTSLRGLHQPVSTSSMLRLVVPIAMVNLSTKSVVWANVRDSCDCLATNDGFRQVEYQVIVDEGMDEVMATSDLSKSRSNFTKHAHTYSRGIIAAATFSSKTMHAVSIPTYGVHLLWLLGLRILREPRKHLAREFQDPFRNPLQSSLDQTG